MMFNLRGCGRDRHTGGGGCSHTDAVSKRERLKGMPWFLLQGIFLLF